MNFNKKQNDYIKSTFENLEGTIEKLNKKVQYTAFTDKLKTAFPISVGAGITVIIFQYLIKYIVSILK